KARALEGKGGTWPSIVLFQLIVYIPTFSLGIPLTMTAFWVFCCKLKIWTETRVYMINLMVADSFLLFALPFVIYFTKYDHPSDNLCTVIENIYFTNRPMSILIITLIAIDRYIAIKFPLKAKILRSPLKSTSTCVFLWITLIIYVNLRQKFNPNKEKFCFQKESTEPNYSLLFSIIFGYFIPLGIVIFCSVQVITCLKKKIATSPYETKKAVYIVSANMAVFIICFLPLYVGHLLRFIMDSISSNCSAIQSVNNFVHLASVLANTNCCLDAICYYFVNKEFKEASPKLAKSKSETSEEAEVQLPCITY
uniref:G-protein coupled receptors family 1 profile domain-containing protein n=1 Tax=Calidris pygmaea TaxID=425635 RepID=A0A8C3JKW5_9CHAR